MAENQSAIAATLLATMIAIDAGFEPCIACKRPPSIRPLEKPNR